VFIFYSRSRANFKNRDRKLNLIGLLITKLAGPANTFVLLYVAYRAMSVDEAAEFVSIYALLPIFFIVSDFGIRLVLPVRFAHASASERVDMFRQYARKQVFGRVIVLALTFAYIQIVFDSISLSTSIFLALYAAFVHVADIAGHILKGLRQSAYEARLVTAQVITSSLLLLAFYYAGSLNSLLAASSLAIPAIARSIFAGYKVHQILGASDQSGISVGDSGKRFDLPQLRPVLELALGVIFARLPIIYCITVTVDSLELAEITIIVMILQLFELASSIISMNSLTRPGNILRPGANEEINFGVLYSQVRHMFLPLLAVLTTLVFLLNWIARSINPASLVNMLISILVFFLLIALLSTLAGSIVNAIIASFLLSHVVLLSLNLRSLGCRLINKAA
jgi:hypothetical protein